MTKDKTFKRRVRERMTKTGESYASARTQVSAKRDRVHAARERLATSSDRPSEAKVKEMTGKGWEQWFAILDRSGAKQRSHKETAAWLIAERGVPGWWAQSITGAYERARGMRLKHQQRDGFTIYASKTIGAPQAELFTAFTDARTRRKWLTDGAMKRRPSSVTNVARFDWDDGTRVVASFDAKGANKTVVAIAHERLPDPDEAEVMKAFWRERLSDLKSFAEGDRS